MKAVFYFLLIGYAACCAAQPTDPEIPLVDEIPVERQAPGTLGRYWLRIGTDFRGRAEAIPVILIHGARPGPVLGITAGIHGNELNGIRTVQRLAEVLDPSALSGSVLAVPGLNPSGMAGHRREFADGEDLNRVFPGKEDGNESQQMAYALSEKLLPHLGFLADLHTASFGRENTLYIRADLSRDTLAQIALGFGADLVLNSREASAGGSTGGTLRATASERGIPGFTVELGNPQVYQQEMIDRGLEGLLRSMRLLGMLPRVAEQPPQPVVCSRSYWIYTDRGGMLEGMPELGEKVTKGAGIGILRDAFGRELTRYYAPEDGIVIGRATNPVARDGGRILHLGIPEAPESE